MNWLALIFNRYTLIGALIVGIYFAGHHYGYAEGNTAGAKAGTEKAAAAEKRAAASDLALADAEIKNLGWQTQLTEVRNALGAERDAAAAQQAQAEKAVAAARADADKSAASLKTWNANFQRALATPTCAAQARIVLCDAFQSY